MAHVDVTTGYVDMISALDCAHAAQLLGSGRQRQSDVIDMAVGLLFTVSLGQPVEEGASLAMSCLTVVMCLL